MSIDLPTQFPNVHARLHRHRRLPGTPEITTTLEIWTNGTRFRIRDGDGRPALDLAADVTEPQGFGRVPRTIEEFMDASSAAARPHDLPTDVYGDLVTGLASVHEPGQAPWTLPVSEIVPAVEQLFLPLDTGAWRPAGTDTRLDRELQLYESEVAGEDDGFAYRSLFRWAVAEPFVLSRHVEDSQNPGLFVTVDVIDLGEGSVGETDLTATSTLSPRER